MDKDWEEDNELPAFPWPMWIPALNWIAHGLLMMALALFIVVQVIIDRKTEILCSLAIFLVSFGFLSVGMGLKLLRGYAETLTHFAWIPFLIALLLTLFCCKAILQSSYLIAAASEAMSLYLSSVITYLYEKPWFEWKRATLLTSSNESSQPP
jgi:hypothetical protein